LTLSPAVFDRNVLSLDIAGFAQPLANSGHKRHEQAGRRAAEEADHRHRLLLRARGERPCDRRATKEALDYDQVRDHNQRTPALWSDDPSYLKDVNAIVVELRRLNVLLEAKRPRKKEAERAVIDLTQHLDTFLKNYAAWFGRGAAALTVGSIASLLHYAGLDPTAVWSIIKLPR